MIDVLGAAEARESGPGAAVLLDNDVVKVVAFRFAAQQVLREHRTRHPILVQAMSGELDLSVQGDAPHRLHPGRIVFLEAMVPHTVATDLGGELTVTMLLAPDR